MIDYEGGVSGVDYSDREMGSAVLSSLRRRGKEKKNDN